MFTRLTSMLLLGTLAAPALSQSRPILIHGHRGARAHRPENTIPALQFGIDHGDDVLELDLAVTRDNVLVVSHSPYLIQPAPKASAAANDKATWAAAANERLCDGPPLPAGTLIHSLTLAQIKQYDCGSHTLANFPHQVAVPGTKIPTFDEVLDLAPQGNFEFNVETKSFPARPEITPTPEAFVKLIDDAVKAHNLQSRVILQSFDFRTLRAMRKLDPKIRLSALFGNPKYDPIMGITDSDKSFAHIIAITGADILSPDISLVTPEEVAVAHKLGVQVAPYTANKPEDWKRLAVAKVDAIITDDPPALLEWLRLQRPPLHP